MKLLIIIMLLIPVLSNCLADGVAEDATVLQVRVDRSGHGIVVLDKSLSGHTAPCTQAGYGNALAFDTNEAGGRAILSIVLAAQASGKKIKAVGTGTCPIYGVLEAWNWGHINS